MLKNFRNKYSDKMFCFSPPVMMFTFLFEILAAFFIWFTYDKHKATKIITALLVCLAIFQLAEYNVCEGAFGISAANWSKIGFVSISLLPPLGIYLLQSLSKTKNQKGLTQVSFGTAAVFSGIFLFTTTGVSPNVCMGNYVIFKVNELINYAYGIYYWGWLIVGVMLSFVEFKRNKNKKIRQAIKYTGIGYLVFMIPTTVVNIIDPVTISGIPSIMCGFAILLAVALVFKVMPNSNIKKDKYSFLSKIADKNNQKG